MDKSIFKSDPIIGCSFDDSELVLTEEHEGIKVKDIAKFNHLNQVLTGEIIAIGLNAKYFNGEKFTALVIKCESKLYYITMDDLVTT